MMEQYFEIFAKNLRRRRRELGLTQKALAERIGYTEKAVNKWERGGGLPPSALLPLLSLVLQTSIDELMSETSEVQYFLGIDGGGTKTEFVLADRCGNVCRRVVLGASSPNDVGMDTCLGLLNDGILEVCGTIPLRKISVFAGIAGGITGENRSRIAGHLARYGFGRAENGSDAQNAVAASLGKADGIAVILGTGAIAFAQCAEQLYRVGGYGYLFGDAGSGFALGRDAILAALRDEAGDGAQTLLTSLVLHRCGAPSILESLSTFYEGGKRRIASYAPLVFEAFEAGDSVAREILLKNLGAVADLIRAAARRMETGGCIRVSLCGGIAHASEQLLPILVACLGEDASRYRIELCERSMAYGALLLAGIEEEVLC
ncbi:MAG: helix-turn-helix domain-containing protein [Clostridia bacterium]|nr:helix-turn-helix domain-containing protein [Clostridia bacterium]